MSWKDKDRQLLTGEAGFAVSGSHTKNATLSSAVTLTKPSGATNLWIQALDQNIRFRLDGTAPDATTGFQLAAGDFLVIPVPGTTVKVIEETATATIQYQWLS